MNKNGGENDGAYPILKECTKLLQGSFSYILRRAGESSLLECNLSNYKSDRPVECKLQTLTKLTVNHIGACGNEVHACRTANDVLQPFRRLFKDFPRAQTTIE